MNLARDHLRQIGPAQAALWLALVLALLGSLRHVAWAFATLEGGDMIAGYIQALAVDVGLVTLAYSVQLRRRERRPTRLLWFGVGLFSAASTYANLLHGLAFSSDIGLGMWAAPRPFILSGVLPLMVLYLSEIVSQDVQHAARTTERERKAAERRSVQESSDSETEARFEQVRQSRDEALEMLVDILADNPETPIVELAARIGRSRTTVYEYLNELEQSGRIHRNGNGVRVL